MINFWGVVTESFSLLCWIRFVHGLTIRFVHLLDEKARCLRVIVLQKQKNNDATGPFIFRKKKEVDFPISPPPLAHWKVT